MLLPQFCAPLYFLEARHRPSHLKTVQVRPEPCFLYVLCKTAGKWQKCNLVSGMASVASDMDWL